MKRWRKTRNELWQVQPWKVLPRFLLYIKCWKGNYMQKPFLFRIFNFKLIFRFASSHPLSPCVCYWFWYYRANILQTTLCFSPPSLSIQMFLPLKLKPFIRKIKYVNTNKQFPSPLFHCTNFLCNWNKNESSNAIFDANAKCKKKIARNWTRLVGTNEKFAWRTFQPWKLLLRDHMNCTLPLHY